MSDTPAAEFREVAGHFGALVSGTPEDRWDSPSPVPEWAARDVVCHLVEWFPAFLERGAGVVLPPGPSPDVDPAGAWQHLYDEVLALLEDPASAGKVLKNPHIGEVPLPQAVSQFFTGDVFQHSWDLAKATGQDPTLDPERCAAMLEGAEPYEDAMRQSGQYGPRVEVPEDADVQTRFIAFLGRDPLWEPRKRGRRVRT
jgi:uncharacterized protein (TIGR03086 family)